MSTGVILGLFGGHLPFKSKMQSVSYEYFWYAWSMLVHLLDPPVYPFKAPFVGDIVHKNDSLSTSRIASNDCAEATLTTCIPKLESEIFAKLFSSRVVHKIAWWKLL